MAKRAGSNASSVGVQDSSDPSPSEYDMAYQNYVASAYARGMYEKRYREMTEAAMEELSQLLVATKEEIVAAIRTKTRVRTVLCCLEAIYASEEASSVALPAMEAFDGRVGKLEYMLRNVEDTLNQLPIENGVLFCENDAEKLNSAVESLAKEFGEFWSGLEGVGGKNWEKYAAILRDACEEDVVLRKNRCDDLMRRINDATLRLSSLRAAKTAQQTLNPPGLT